MLFYKEQKRTQECCVLLKRTHAQPCKYTIAHMKIQQSFFLLKEKKKLIKQKQLVAVFLTLLSQRDSLSRLGITIDDASGQIRGCCFIYKKIVPCFPTFILKKQEVAVHFINSLNYMQSEFPEILRSCRTTY